MKNIYMTPEMETVEIKVHQMLASSPIPVDNTPTDPANSDAPEIYEILTLFDE